MPKFNGINYKELLTDVEVVYACPYCLKQFFNKKSYRNHILGKYCPMCDIETGKGMEVGIQLNLFEEEDV